MEHNKILVVEDDKPISDTIKLVLEMEGFVVETFANGQLALDRLKRDAESCLIFLDLLMPVMNGWEFMKEFAKLPVTIVPIPVYLLSVVKEKPGETAEMGCRAFIKKPVSIDVILKIANDHCKQS